MDSSALLPLGCHLGLNLKCCQSGFPKNTHWTFNSTFIITSRIYIPSPQFVSENKDGFSVKDYELDIIYSLCIVYFVIPFQTTKPERDIIAVIGCVILLPYMSRCQLSCVAEFMLAVGSFILDPLT